MGVLVTGVLDGGVHYPIIAHAPKRPDRDLDVRDQVLCNGRARRVPMGKTQRVQRFSRILWPEAMAKGRVGFFTVTQIHARYESSNTGRAFR